MRTAHERSCQSWGVLLAAFALVACHTETLPDSMWPPPDFEIRLEEMSLEGGGPRVTKRFRALASGLVSWGTSSRSLVDPETKAQLPVWDTLSVYRLVPTSLRALARRIDRAGVASLDTRQGERGAKAATWLVLTWRAFDRANAITATGRLHGSMADIVSIVMAHMPDGAAFDLPGLVDRPVVPVLRGVPAPATDAGGALDAFREMLAEHPGDRTMLEDAFALASSLGRRATAEALLEEWSAATADARRVAQQFPEGEPGLTPAVLQRLLPSGS